MLYKQITEIPKKTIKEKLNLFFKEDQIKKDITTNNFIDKNKIIEGFLFLKKRVFFVVLILLKTDFLKKLKYKNLFKMVLKLKQAQQLQRLKARPQKY